MNYSDDQIKKTIALYNESNLSIKDFCNLNNITLYAFDKWRKKFPNITSRPALAIKPSVNKVAQQDNFINIDNPHNTSFCSSVSITLGELHINFEEHISYDDFKFIMATLGIKPQC